MIRRALAAAALLLASPASAQTVTVDQAKAAAATAVTYVTANPLWACDPSRSDGFNATYYAAHNSDVVANGMGLLVHWERYGRAEGRKPCEPQAVTQTQAVAGLSTVTAYLAQPIVTAVAAPDLVMSPEHPYARNPSRSDGFNPTWYAHAYPDVVAAGVDLLAHWLANGRSEGRLPYEGAQPFVPVTPDDFLQVGAPQLRVPDVYVPAGTRTVRVQAFLERGGKVAERSYNTVTLIAVNSPFGISGGSHGFFPSSGGKDEWTVDLSVYPEGWSGNFQVSVFSQHDWPQLRAVATVHVGGTAPAGYVYPAPMVFAATTPVPSVISTKPAYDDDLHDLSDWDMHEYGLNGMNGIFVVPGKTTTVSGKHPDPLPWIPGVGRRLLPTDQRSDLIYLPATNTYARWGMPAFERNIGGATGVWLVRERLANWIEGEDSDTWGIRQDHAWSTDMPTEIDHVERFHGAPGVDMMTTHGAGGTTASFGRLNAPTGWHERVWQRTDAAHEPVFRLPMYRQWVRAEGGDWVLTVECPDYVAGQAVGTVFNIEGFGSGAGGGNEPVAANDNTPYDAHANGADADVSRVANWAPD